MMLASAPDSVAPPPPEAHPPGAPTIYCGECERRQPYTQRNLLNGIGLWCGVCGSLCNIIRGALPESKFASLGRRSRQVSGRTDKLTQEEKKFLLNLVDRMD